MTKELGKIDLNEIYCLLNHFIKTSPNNISLKLKAFLDKLSDSNDFASKTQTEFNKIRVNEAYQITKKLRYKPKTIELYNFPKVTAIKNEFGSYSLYIFDELYLDSLDAKLIKKIAIDINVAINIKNNRDAYEKTDTTTD